jgi:hypothetical protein
MSEDLKKSEDTQVIDDEFGPPSKEFMKDFKYEATSDAVASRDQVKAVKVKWVALGLPENNFFAAALQLALACSDSHASSLTALHGPVAAHTALALRDLASALKAHCTLRQFCRFYAKFVWNYRIKNDAPPGAWAAMGFTHDTRFAAFDFFDGVTNPAALQPPEGLVRPPTERELAAHHTGKFVATTRATHSGHLSLAAEVTRGRLPPADVQARLLGP